MRHTRSRGAIRVSWRPEDKYALKFFQEQQLFEPAAAKAAGFALCVQN
jgi:hypothetical protein